MIPARQVVPLHLLLDIPAGRVWSREFGCSQQLLPAGLCEVHLSLLKALLGWRRDGAVRSQSSRAAVGDKAKAIKSAAPPAECSEKQREERTVIFCDSTINRALWKQMRVLSLQAIVEGRLRQMSNGFMLLKSFCNCKGEERAF